MANPTNSRETLVRGLSSFWLRMFHDRGTLDALYRSTEQQLGQAYFDILEAALARSLKHAPVFHREYWRLLEIREDEGKVSTVGGSTVYDFPLGRNLAAVNYLFDQVVSPSLVLETGRDFEVVQSDGDSWLRFYGNSPFRGSGAKIPWVTTDLATAVIDEGREGTLIAENGQLYFTLRDGYQYSQLDLGRGLELLSSRKGSYTVRSSDGTRLGLGPTDFTNATYPHIFWKLYSHKSVRSAALWAPDAQVDLRTLSDCYGHLVGDEQDSSEAYRMALQGLFQAHILGPTLGNIEAALNLICGFPVVETEGEVVASADTSTGLVVTDKRTYVVPVGSVKSTVVEGAELPAFSSLTDVFTVVDSARDPIWWAGVTIPPFELPEEVSTARRQVSVQLFDNRYDNPPGLVRFGDPGVFYGADDTGYVIPDSNGDGTPNRPGLRHNFAYMVMDRFLKHTTFGVKVREALLPAGVTLGSVESFVRGVMPPSNYLHVLSVA